MTKGRARSGQVVMALRIMHQMVNCPNLMFPPCESRVRLALEGMTAKATCSFHILNHLNCCMSLGDSCAGSQMVCALRRHLHR